MLTAMTRTTMVPMTVMMMRTKKMKDFLWSSYEGFLDLTAVLFSNLEKYFQTDDDDQDDGSDYEYDNQILDELGPI